MSLAIWWTLSRQGLCGLQAEGAQMSWLKRRAEEAAKTAIPCTCADDYKLRNRSDPQCFWCQHDEDVLAVVEAVAREFAIRTTNALRMRLHCEHKLRSGDSMRAALAIADSDKDEP